MGVKNMGVPFSVLFLLLLCTNFSSAEQQQLIVKNPSPVISPYSTVFPIQGNVYPLGYYTVPIVIGSPPKVYELDLDFSSDFTWLQCDLGCDGCTLPKDKLYKPHGNLAKCTDPLCAEVGNECVDPNSPCVYQVPYSDHGSSTGSLVRDSITEISREGSELNPIVAFGCGYKQIYYGPTPPPSTRGVLGLANGKLGILSQLHSLGLIRNVVGHILCFQGNGTLFFGDDLVLASYEIVWIPIMQNNSSDQKHYYNSGPADLLFNGKPTSVKSLQLTFDSGSSYTYFNSQAYQVVLDLVTTDLKGKPLSRTTEDYSTLPICWKGTKPFKSLSDVNTYFSPLALSFPNFNNSQFELPPQAYLIITQLGNVCLGILNAADRGLGNVNLIGDISMLNKVVIYDNEKQRIGWSPGPRNCV